MLRVILVFAFSSGLLASVHADEFSNMKIAMDLGSILGSEKPCNLAYNQDAVAAFIEKKVDAADMSFTSTLNLSTDSTEMKFEEMSESQKTAHCTQVKRVATKYGFIKSP